MKINPLPDADVLRELFSYNPDDGLLRWKRAGGGKRVGDVAGGINSQGYMTTRVGGKIVRVHRVIWKMVKGVDPDNEIEHYDLVRTNNRWNNIREADKSQNCANRRVQSTSTTGLKGAFPFKSRDCFYSKIKKGGKLYFLGYFRTAQEAHEAYMGKSAELYGQYSRAA